MKHALVAVWSLPRRCGASLVWAATLFALGRMQAADPIEAGPNQAGSGPVYAVRRLILEYGPRGSSPHPDLPSIDELYRVKVDLGQEEETVVGPRAGQPVAPFSLVLTNGQTRFAGDALVAINRALIGELNRRGIYGVWAAPDGGEIDPRTGMDVRRGREDLHLIIEAAEIRELRTIARGDRLAGAEPVNHPAHRRLAAHSPLQPPGADGRGSLFDKLRLEDYVGRLNRVPGRNVDAAVSPSTTPGGMALEYFVREDKPWLVYANAENTGTEVSGEFRERFGFLHQQLTGRDDSLGLDYVTADFEHSHAFFGNYELPILYPDRLKAQAFGSYSQYTADDLGLDLQQISGSTRSAGGEFTWGTACFRPSPAARALFAPFYLDLSLGARWEGIDVDNETFGVPASTDLLIPYLGLNLSSVSAQTKLRLGIQFEGNLESVAGTDPAELPFLGRLDTDAEWVLANWGGNFSLFLNPLLDPGHKRLTHEVSISSRGQYVFDNRRMIPQQAELIGGFHSVRGYPEAFDLGDTVFVGTFEYRYYLGRALRPTSEETVSTAARAAARAPFGNPFRSLARDLERRPDWDILLRAFLDGGQTFNNRRRPSETDRSALGAGVGLELQLRRNLNLRVDYGIALLSETENLAQPVDAGDGRVHLSATLAW